MKKFLLVVALSLLAAACTSSTPGGMSRWMEAYGPNFPAPKPGQAALYLVRGDAAPDAPPISLTMGRQPLGSLTGLTWMLFDLPPDLCDLRAFGTQESTELIITAAAGETRFLLVQPTPDGNVELLELSPAEGRRLVRQGQHMQEML
jgi:hypothetical protein